MQNKLKALALLALMVTASAWSAPAQVLVVFKIDSAKFKSGLEQAVPDTEAAIAGKMAKQLKAMFPPFDWTAVPPADGAAATLVATLDQEGALLPNILLRWSAKVGKDDLALHALRDWTIYSSKKPVRPYRDSAQLIADIDAQMRVWMGTDNTEESIHDDFIRWVPLATKVKFDETQKSVLIPLAWGPAKIGDESEFRLEFMRADPLSKMKVLLNGVAERLSGDMRGNTQSIVASCVASGVPVASDVWNTCVAILEQANAPPLLVSFERYKFGGAPGGISPLTGTANQP